MNVPVAFDPTDFDMSECWNYNGFFYNTDALANSIYAVMKDWNISDCEDGLASNGAVHSINPDTGNVLFGSKTALGEILTGCANTLERSQYDDILTSWNTQASGATADFVCDNMVVDFGAADPESSAALAARANLVKSVALGGKGWTITDGV